MKLLPVCAFLLLALVASAMAGPLPPFLCNCGLGSGENICSQQKKKQCSPLVVRPMEVPIPTLPKPKIVSMPVGGVAPLVPIAGPCSCAASLVKPATVPRPACSCVNIAAANQQTNMNMNMNMNQQRQIIFGSGYGSAASRPVLVDQVVNPENPANYVPADPISLGLAYKMSQEACHHDEDRLAFGFRQIPKDIPLFTKKRVNNIPEGDLYNLNGQIVELKKVACMQQKKSLDEEAIEELISAAAEEEEREQAEAEFKKVSLGEIGYGPAKIKGGAFVSVQGSGGAGIDIEDTPIAAGPCNDGYKPGNVLITQIPQPSPVAMPIPLPEPCGSEEEVDIPAVPTFQNGFSSPYTFVSQQSASSSSCANKLSQSVVLQKLGCN